MVLISKLYSIHLKCSIEEARLSMPTRIFLSSTLQQFLCLLKLFLRNFAFCESLFQDIKRTILWWSLERNIIG